MSDALHACEILNLAMRPEAASTRCYRVGVSKVTAWYWWTGAAVPCLPMALRICFSLGLDFVNQIQSGVYASGGYERGISGAQIEFHFTTKPIARQLDWVSARKTLSTESRRAKSKAKPLALVARELEIQVRHLRAREPVLCRRIASRSRERKFQDLAAKQEQLRKDIRAVCVKMRRGGLPLTQANIAAALERPGLFSRPTARRVLGELFHKWPESWPRQITFPSGQSLR